MRELILIRGLPGSGKSTLAKIIGDVHVEADMFFMKDDQYFFDLNMLSLAHAWCKVKVQELMVIDTPKIVVSNTFTRDWEMDAYYELAENYGYRVHSIVVENRHDGVNIHNVPDETLIKMKERFELKL